MESHAYPYAFHIADELPHTLADLHTADLYARDSRLVMHIPLGPEDTKRTGSLSNRQQDNYTPILYFNDQLSAIINLRNFHASLYTCMDIWLTFDQITDVQYPLGDLSAAPFEQLHESLQSHSFDYNFDSYTSQLFSLSLSPSTIYS